MRKSGWMALLALAGTLLAWGTPWAQTQDQRIGPILTDVETAFGTYRPAQVTLTPSVQARTPAEDFSGVENFQSFAFGEEERESLRQNGFVLTPSGFRQVHELYNSAKKRGIPIFVTTDAMLHTFHVLYDYTLRILEVRRFSDDLNALSRAMLGRMQAERDAASDAAVRGALLKNAAYFSVALSLLDPAFEAPEAVGGLVAQELALIAAHEGFVASPIFGMREDYSQYVPRGHYTRTEGLKRFFGAMMWYGRIGFRLRNEDGTPNRAGTLGAMLIARALETEAANEEPALTVWDRIYEPTVFFVGKADDLTAREYTELMASVYGADYRTLGADALGNRALIDRFIGAAEALRDPLIISTAVADTVADPEASTKSFRFMGQRFVPDSYMFQQLVYKYVGTQADPRLFPRGLDVMAVLGSETAFALLDTLYGETRFLNYREQMEKLQAAFVEMPPETWAQNLYWNWLYCLLPLLEPKGEGYPAFMQGDAWTRRGLNAALGSWAELRHDTILYAKQSYTVETTSMPMPDPFLYGYVEPEPGVFGRLAALAGLMRDGLSQRGLLLSEFDGKLGNFERLCLALREIAEKELTGVARTEEDYRLIWDIGGRLEGLLTFSDEISDEITTSTDEDMAVIADVHTDPNSRQVLEVGVGRPFALYAIVEDQGKLKVAKGAGFSYYEFKQPMADRLTDEAWQDRLDRGEASGVPGWMRGLTVGARMEELGERPGGRRVDFALFLEFVQSVNAKSGDANYRTVFDFDGNDVIDFTDFVTFAKNYNRVVYWVGL